jgi:hypothetical protein
MWCWLYLCVMCLINLSKRINSYANLSKATNLAKKYSSAIFWFFNTLHTFFIPSWYFYMQFYSWFMSHHVCVCVCVCVGGGGGHITRSGQGFHRHFRNPKAKCAQIWLGNTTGQILHSSYGVFLFLEKDTVEFYGKMLWLEYVSIMFLFFLSNSEKLGHKAWN